MEQPERITPREQESTRITGKWAAQMAMTHHAAAMEHINRDPQRALVHATLAVACTNMWAATLGGRG